MKEILEKTKPVEEEIEEVDATQQKTELADLWEEERRRRNILPNQWNQFLKELTKRGVLKYSASEGRAKFMRREKPDQIIEPIDGEGIYTYNKKFDIHVSAGLGGEIWRSLPGIKEKVIIDEQPRKKRSKERPKQDTELLKRFENLMSEPLKLLSSLEEKFKQEKSSARSPIDLLKIYAKQLNYAIKNHDDIEARALISDLGDLGIEYHGEFDRDMFENTIVPEAEKHNLIEKTSENEFTREDIKKAKKENRWVMDQAKWEEIYYQWWENAQGGIFHIDVYAFKGNKDSEIQSWIFNDLKQGARMVGDIEWIKSSIAKWRDLRRREEKIPETQRKADRKKADEAIKFAMRKQPEETEGEKIERLKREEELERERKVRREAKREKGEFVSVEGDDWKDQLETVLEQMQEQEKKEKRKKEKNKEKKGKPSAKKKTSTKKKASTKKKPQTKKKTTKK